MITVEVEGLGRLEFDDETPENVIQAVVKRELADKAKQQPQKADMSWLGVAGSAIRNTPASAGRFVADTMHAVTHPVQTVKAVSDTMIGGAQNLAERVTGRRAPEWTRHDDTTADAVGEFYAGRFGGIDNIKNTLATDPVGAAADAAGLLMGGGAAAARAPGAVGRMGTAAREAGHRIDPIEVAGRGAKLVGKGLGETAAATLGVTTGAGATPIKTATRTGYSGSVAENMAYLENLRGTVPRERVVSDARAALQAIREDRGSAYTRQMSLLRQNAAPLDFQPVLDEWNKLQQSFLAGGGSVSRLSEKSQQTLRNVGAVIEEWARTPAAHTIEGFDALKQRLGDEGGNYSSMSPQEQRVITSMTQAVKSVIEKQAPEYAQIMKAYSDESKLIDDLSNTLSLGSAKTVDAALRKLQSAMRNNANTTWGRRLDLVQELEQRGGRPLIPALAGQDMNNPAPRGLAQLGYTVPASLAGNQFLQGDIVSGVLAAAPALVMQSPRVVGEAAHKAGRAGRAIRTAAGTTGVTSPTARELAAALYQGGRADRTATEEKRRRALDAVLGR